MHPDADKITVASNLVIKYRGIFDASDLYFNMKEWLNYSNFGDETNSFKEKSYTERIKPNGKQIEIVWEGENYRNDYISQIIEVVFFIVGLQDVEITHEGKKIKMNSGDLEIRFSGSLVKNRKGKWRKDSFIKKIYENIIIKNRLADYKNETYQKITSFRDEVKTYLNLHQI